MLSHMCCRAPIVALQGIRCWVVLRSQLGVPVGAVQLEVCFTHIGGTHWDSSPAGVPPLIRQVLSNAYYTSTKVVQTQGGLGAFGNAGATQHMRPCA